jgi:hypothetical protein
MKERKNKFSILSFLISFLLANAIISGIELIAPFPIILSGIFIFIYTFILYTKFKNLFNEIKEDKNENIMLKNE